MMVKKISGKMARRRQGQATGIGMDDHGAEPGKAGHIWRAAAQGLAHLDRVLIAALGLGALLGAVLLWWQIDGRIHALESVLANQIRLRASAIDVQMQAAQGHLEALRQRAELFYAEYPAPAEMPQGSLLTAFLASNPGNDPALPYSLDRLPPPYLTSQIGNLIALSADDATQQPEISRADPGAWRQEAAMMVQLLPLMAVTQKVVPEVRRLLYISRAGMVALHPWVRSDETDLLLQLATTPAFRHAGPALNPQGGPVWTLSAPDQPDRMVTLSLPLTLEGRFLGSFTLDVPLAGIREKLGSVIRTDAAMLLVDGTGHIIASSQDGPAPALLDDVLPGGMERLAGGGPLHGFNQPFTVSAALKSAPWHMVYVTPPFSLLLVAMQDVVISVLGFIASLLVLLFIVRRLMQRALKVRDQAVQAERNARASAERALADLRAAHDELDFLNREKTRFFSLVSHDLRGPFNSMLGMTQELADHAPRMSAEDTADFARTVHEMARKVFDLLENLLQWSRVQMSGTPFAPMVFPVRDVVGDAVRDVASAALAKDIQVLDAVGDRWVLADRTMALAILRNLLMNAVKFSHPGGVVHVTSRAQGDRLEIAVTDKGIGMEPSQLQQLLRAGPGASRPGTQGETGTGLGLTLVRDLALRHGGELRLESEPGRGTIASFTLPLSADPAETRRLAATVD